MTLEPDWDYNRAIRDRYRI